MKKPTEAIERMKAVYSWGQWGDDVKAVLAYLDSIPDNAIPVVWPEGLTREKLEWLAVELDVHHCPAQIVALKSLAAIAPEAPKKRVMQLWVEVKFPHRDPIALPIDREPKGPFTWRKVGKPFEVEE